jgi:hypothetical protein
MKDQLATDIREAAWQIACIGDYKQAREKLHQAADLKDLRAIAFLAHSYSYGSLITEVDPTQAQKFQRIVDGQKELKYRELIDEIESKKQFIADESFAWLQPLWYQQLVSRASCEFAVPCNIENIVRQSVLDFYEDKFSQDMLPLLVQGISELHSYDLYRSVFEDLYYETYDVFEQLKEDPVSRAWNKRVLNPRKKSVLLSVFLHSMHDWAVIHGRQRFLAKMYKDEIWRAYECAGKDVSKREESAEIIDAIFPLLYQVDEPQALSLLNDFWEFLSNDVGLETYQYIYVVALKYTYLNPSLIFQYSKIILEDNFTLKSMLKFVLEHPVVISYIENTPLDLKCLIRKSCELALARGAEQNDGPFLTLLNKGKKIHETHQDIIVSSIPPYIKSLKHFNSDLINDFLTSPCQSIRVVAFREIVEFYTSHELNSYDVSDLKMLLAHDLSNIFIDSTTFGSYRYFYEASKQNSSMLCLQCLWGRLSCSTDEQEQIFLKKTMQEILTIKFPEKTLPYSFKNLLDTILDIAIKQPKVPASMWQFLICASKSGIVEIMDQELLEKLKTKCLVDEEMPLEVRCQFFNDLLAIYSEKDKIYSNISVVIESLPESIFKEYARAVIVAINPQ